MLERDRFVANEKLVRFLTEISEVLELQLQGVCNSINTALGSIMESVTEISTSTEAGRRMAEETLEKTYFSPDVNTENMISSIQDSVDAILQSVSQGGVTTEEKLKDNDAERRLVGRFSKHMEALSTLDGDLQDFMMVIMGALSNEDVISQRIEHVARSLNALKLGLAYVLVDIDSRFTFEGIQKLKRDMLSYTKRQYTTEDERILHEKWFKAG